MLPHCFTVAGIGRFKGAGPFLKKIYSTTYLSEYIPLNCIPTLRAVSVGAKDIGVIRDYLYYGHYITEIATTYRTMNSSMVIDRFIGVRDTLYSVKFSSVLEREDGTVDRTVDVIVNSGNIALSTHDHATQELCMCICLKASSLLKKGINGIILGDSVLDINDIIVLVDESLLLKYSLTSFHNALKKKGGGFDKIKDMGIVS